MMSKFRSVALLGLGLGLLACGSSGSGGKGAASADLPEAKRSGKKSAGGLDVSKAAVKQYKLALETFLAHDRAYDWNPAACKKSAEAFTTVSKQQSNDSGKPLPEALYNAGLSYMRCGQEEQAAKQFQAAMKASGDFHRARGQMALFEYKNTNDIDSAISNLERIIRDAKFQNVEALVSVAALQMERGNEIEDDDGANDFERAKKNVQRALAIDDSFMPAMNQLAIYYMEQAKRKAGKTRGRRRRGLVVAGAERTRANRQQLDLAQLVAEQGITKDPNYAPLRNTAGLISVELRNYNGAVRSFGRARDLNPDFFEAHMNYAAVSLSFRGFKEAEKAYRDALRLEPRDYEAHLGLALALRGQITDVNYDTYLAEAKKHLEECKKIDANRAEAYYNEAILTQEYEAKGGDSSKSVPALKSAVAKYEEFIRRAKGQAAFAEAVKRSKDRAQDIGDTVQFIEEGERIQQEQDELERKAKEAEKKAAAAAAAAGPSSAPASP